MIVDPKSFVKNFFSTPLCVLLEIADSFGICYEDYEKYSDIFIPRLVKILNEVKPFIIDNDNPTEKDFRLMARLINSRCSWDKESLIDAYNFFVIHINGSLINGNYGLQTPEQPENINDRILYMICQKAGVKLYSNTDSQQMIRIVEHLNDSKLQNKIIDAVLKSDNRNLLNLLPFLDIDTEKPSDQVSFKTLTDLLSSLNDPKSLRKMIEPTHNNGAVALAAINFSINISCAKEPIKAYRYLATLNNLYWDDTFSFWYNTNRYGLAMDYNFSPIFPAEYYKNLQILATMEGFSVEEISGDNAYNLLQLAYLSNTFYLGTLPELTKTETIVDLEPIKDVPYELLLCYGQRETDNMIAITFEELHRMFEVSRSFCDPFDSNSLISNTAINKLRFYCCMNTDPMFKKLDESLINIKKKLFSLIEKLTFENKDIDPVLQKLLQNYRKGSSELKGSIYTTLRNLLHAGMYMRGWEGEEQGYPLAKAPVPAEKALLVDIRVNNGINVYENNCKQMGYVGTLINSLPLFRYSNGQYIKSKSEKDGFTIGERIAIVKQGSSSKNMASCIRMSSNWIISSVHKYMLDLGYSAPFEIFFMREIS